MMRRPPTIVDVAVLAGVSKSTVSNVIRDADGVAAGTRERVQEAIGRLAYRPNALARQFVAQRTTTLGVLVGDLDNPFYAEMAKLIERWAFHHGYLAMFCNIEGEDDLALSGIEQRADRGRHAGYRIAMRRAALKARPPIRWRPGDELARVAGGRVALAEVLAGAGRPSAVFVSNDMGAIALQEFMDVHGLRVPEDVSLVGFDNVGLAGLARISLTTIAQPLEDLSRLGVQRLAELIEADGRLPAARQKPRAVTVPVSLVVRGSSGPAPR
jgi:DNA-binding LacI/PurR family transcriptional regulator